MLVEYVYISYTRLAYKKALFSLWRTAAVHHDLVHHQSMMNYRCHESYWIVPGTGC